MLGCKISFNVVLSGQFPYLFVIFHNQITNEMVIREISIKAFLMAKLYILRHAETRIDSVLGPDNWELDDGARDSVARLLKGIPITEICCIYSSPLPKASRTADIIGNIYGIAKNERDCLREVKRYFPYVDDMTFGVYVEEFLSGKDDLHFEPYPVARERIVNCIGDILKESSGKSVIVVSHGMVISVLYSHLTGRILSKNDWKNLKMPDLSVIDIDSGIVERGFFSGFKINLK